MSLVRFAAICDHCTARSIEYSRWWICSDCGADTCDACAVPGSGDPETGRALCRTCSAEAQEQARAYANSKITAERFLEATGKPPRDDDLERCNCERAGQVGHSGCGWCDDCNQPFFLGCPHFHQRLDKEV